MYFHALRVSQSGMTTQSSVRTVESQKLKVEGEIEEPFDY